VQYGSPTLSSSSSTREQQSMTKNFSTNTPESPFNAPYVYNTEQSPRLNVHSPVVTRQAPAPPPPPPPSLSQFEPTNHVSQHLLMKQTIARPSASPPPPPPPPPPLPV
jgi:hypothetical protein